MYPLTPESITTRDAIDRALVAEERASRLAAEVDDLRDANLELAQWLVRALIANLLHDADRGRMP